MEDRAIPVKDDLFDNLDPEKVVEFFESSKFTEDKISNVPLVLPIEGQIFLFDLGQDANLWEKRNKQMRYEHS